MAKNKWELKLNDNVEDPYYVLTNGQTTLIANCGFVGETDEDEYVIFKKVADTLNESGIEFHSANALELDQHIRIMILEYALENIIEINRQHALDQFSDAEKAETWDCIIVARQALKK